MLVNRFLRALREPAFPRITTADVYNRIKERLGVMSETGEIYTVPFGLTVHCAVCGETLVPGKQCWIEHSDSSSILCLRCVSKRQAAHTKVGPTEFKPKRAHRRTGEWMQYD